MSDNIEQLKILHNYLQLGIISKEEYDEKKKLLLNFSVDQNTSKTSQHQNKMELNNNLSTKSKVKNEKNTSIWLTLLPSIGGVLLLLAVFFYLNKKSSINVPASEINMQLTQNESLDVIDENSKNYKIGIAIGELIFSNVTPNNFKELKKYTKYSDLISKPPYDIWTHEMYSENYKEQNESAYLGRVEFDFPEYQMKGSAIEFVQRYGIFLNRDAMIHEAIFPYYINIGKPSVMNIADKPKYENLFYAEDFEEILEGIKAKIPAGFKLAQNGNKGLLIQGNDLTLLISYGVNDHINYIIFARVVFDNEEERLSQQKKVLDQREKQWKAEQVIREHGFNISTEQRKEIEPGMTESQKAAMDASDATRKAVQKAMNK